jgi:hypothetical protein
MEETIEAGGGEEDGGHNLEAARRPEGIVS